MLARMRRDEHDALYRLMLESFPRDELRSCEDQRALLDEPTYLPFVVRGEGDEIVALMTVWELDEVVFLEHFAVSPALRGGGLGSRLLSELIERYDRPICLEVELPETETARRRIGFYRRNGFYLNEYDYVQPAYGKDRESVPLLIMTTGGEVDETAFARLRDALYREVYHCPT
ncbi:MAG: GNAT family N-acetyltransferase [Clostridia bacterium]|nr:GNAT family N-acetyltransferase [Clostridia bacterium]